MLCEVYCNCLELLNREHDLVIATEQDAQDSVITFRFTPDTSSFDSGAILSDTLLAAIEKLNGKVTINDVEKGRTECRVTVASLPVETAP